MVHRRELNGETLIFGNQGALYGNAMTWWDHRTGSIWSQPRGEAILGPLTGVRLELLPSTLTTWGDWTAEHPASLALDVPGGAAGAGLDEMAIVVDLGTEVVAYHVRPLREVGVVDDVVAGVDIAVTIDPDDPQRWVVFSRRLDEGTVQLEEAPDGLLDRVTGSIFDRRGVGRSGPLRGEVLDRLPAFTIFPKDFPTFFSEGRSWPHDR